MAERRRAGRRTEAEREGLASPSRAHGTALALACVLVAIVLIGAARWRIAATPLERDEGEYAYVGQLILHGVPPYQLAANMKFPGTYYAYALSMAVFGQTASGVRFGLIVVSSLSTLLVFLLGRRAGGDAVGAMAATGFALLAVDRQVLGPFAHATHYVLPPVLAGFLVLTGATGRAGIGRLIAAGVLLGAAVIVKQHAAFFLPLGALLVFVQGRISGRALAAIAFDMLVLALASLLPFALVCGVLAAQGAFASFWFWTIRYAQAYVSEIPLGEAGAALGDALATVSRAAMLLWIAAGVGVASLWSGRTRGTLRLLLAGLPVAAFLAICPGFYFRVHYFILLLPALALLAALGCAWIGQLLARGRARGAATPVALACFAVAAGALFVHEREVLFALTPAEVSRTIYTANPFVESAEVGRWIRAHSEPAARVAVLGSEPEIYFYSQRRSATRYLYMYPLLEEQPYAARMRAEMMHEVESAAPEYVVYVHSAGSWLLKAHDMGPLFDWAQHWLEPRYDAVGVAEVRSATETRYVWGDSAATASPTAANHLIVFRRRVALPRPAGTR